MASVPFPDFVDIPIPIPSCSSTSSTQSLTNEEATKTSDDKTPSASSSASASPRKIQRLRLRAQFEAKPPQGARCRSSSNASSSSAIPPLPTASASSSQASQPVRPRSRSKSMSYGSQVPQSPSANMAHQQQQQNGMNGGMGMGMGNGMVGYPTPAGHQSDLNYVMSMVDELSGILRQNQQLTSGVIDKVGKVREKAATMNLNNDEVINAVASEMNEESKNLEKENAELRRALEMSEYNKNENWKLAIHGAQILGDISEKMHKYKEQHEKDTLTWHKNYRNQLAAEREENLNLRNQINDMKASAVRANGHLRDMRKYFNDHDELQELRTEVHHYRTAARSWKRMALPLIPADDSEWSDDDDLIDPEEKKRQAEKAELTKAAGERMKREEGEGSA